jgi:hypothetical protein
MVCSHRLRDLRLRFFAVALVVCLLQWAPIVSYAQKAKVNEFDIRTAAVYRIAQFIEWPETAFTSANFVVCHTRVSPAYALALTGLERQTLAGKKVELKVISVEESLKPCQIVVTDGGERDTEKWIERVKGNSTLLVAEGEAAVRAGAGVSFIVDEKLTFGVNKDTLSKAQLTASSKMLQLAAVVVKDGK